MNKAENPIEPAGYVDRSIWAEEMTREGFKQYQCKICRLFTIWKKQKVYKTCDCEK